MDNVAAAVSLRRHDLSALAFALGLLLIASIGAALRFYRLSELPLWMDEAYSYFISAQALMDILFNRLDNHPPLFYAIQHLWTLVDPKVTAIRVPAAFFGSATVLAIGLATGDLMNRRAGLAASALLALSTAHIYFSQDARMYAQLVFGLTLAVWGLIGLVERPGRWRYPILYIAGGGIAIFRPRCCLVQPWHRSASPSFGRHC